MTKFLTKFKEKPLLCLLSLLFLLVAALTRFLYLDNKPIHFDESINMWFVQRIWEDGFFKYDPTNYHGPLLFYLIQFVQLFTGFDYLSTRWVATIFSFLSLVVLWYGPKEHRTALRWAAVFLLFSPGMGFYGRSGIHESAFVFFQILGFMSFHYLVARDFKKFWWTFIGSLLGMMALKETFVVLILAFIPAALVVFMSERKKIAWSKWTKDLVASFKTTEVSLPLLGMFLLFLGVYAGFGAHPKGLLDFFVALMPWLKTGVHGSGHEKEFLYWGKLIATNEFAILVGFLIGFLFALKNKWIRFYLVFTVFLWAIYSAIPYKTPWCLISILWPFAVVAGFAIQDLKGKLPKAGQFGLYAVLILLFGFESHRMYTVMYKNPIDMQHPYVYVNSSYQMKEFVAKTQQVLRENPLLREQTLQIGTEESWPVPVVLHKFYNISYFRTDAKIEDNALIYMVDMKDKDVIEKELLVRNQAAKYQGFILDVRQGRSHILVYVKREFFQDKFSWELKELGTL
ncbi:flippase activity-associated protein Agl23 [Bdellovibrio sp. HCB337]|uniref:flippase activity-associated protein Agl23 n=1 Tax=Bdellovibrio sp. HCB337 TaxID=3394358 RepID=UPI0039A439C6